MTILVVEDHDTLRRWLCEWLQELLTPARVRESTTGEEAVALVQAEPPQLIVMDIDLPGIDGLKATRQIKALIPTIPVVILTVYDDEIHRAAAMAAGANAFLSKLTLHSELLPVLQALLAPHTEGVNRILCPVYECETLS